MSHEISEIDLALGAVERHNNEPVSWHGLEKVRENLSITNCGLRELNVKVATSKLFLNDEEFPSSFRVPVIAHPIHEDKLLPLGRPYEDTYQLFTPADFTDFIKQCFEAAGLDDSVAFTTTLFEGRRMTLAKALPDSDFKDSRGNEIKSYLNFLNSLDGTWPVFCNISEIRTVCMNTATANLGEGGISARHTPEGLAKFIRTFPNTLKEAVSAHANSANDYLQMAAIPVNKAQASHFFTALLASGSSKLSTVAFGRVQELMKLFKEGRGCYGESAADLYNATTEYYTHNFDAESNQVGGTADKRKRDAKEILLSPRLSEFLEKGDKLLKEYDK